MSILNNLQVTIDTTVPTLTIGQIQLSADRRSTKEKPLTDAERIRRAVLPANHWGEIAGTIDGTANQSLTDVLRTALVAIGSDRLRDTLTAEPMQRTINLSDYTVAALLAWNAETATSRGSLTFTREQVEAWWTASATRAALANKHAAKGTAIVGKLLDLAGTRFATLAAKNHGLKTVEEVLKLSSLIDDGDMDGTAASLTTEIIGRLEHIKKALEAKANETTISMDDL